MQQSIQAVFLDAGNTLFTERSSRAAMYAEAARDFGGDPSAEHATRALSTRMQELPTSVEGCYRFSIGWFRELNRRVCEDLGVPEERLAEAHESLVRRFEDPARFLLFAEVPRVLEELANRGLLLGVVSNWSERLPVLLEALGIGHFFAFAITSAEIRSEKPDRSIFERALFRAGTPAAETLHVGDHFDRDVRGALGAGLRAALLERNGDTERERSGNGEGVPVLGDLRQLLELAVPSTHAPSS